MCPSASRVCSEPGGQKPVPSLSLDHVQFTEASQAWGKRAFPSYSGCWLAQTNYDALMIHHTTKNILVCLWFSQTWYKFHAQGLNESTEMPGEGTPSMLGDMDVLPFWPPFLTFWGLNSIFWGYFLSSTNTKTIFWGIKTTNSYRIRSFWPQIPFFPRSFWVEFSAASGTPPSVFGPSTPPPSSRLRWQWLPIHSSEDNDPTTCWVLGRWELQWGQITMGQFHWILMSIRNT